jgi:beta-glucosidase/6-phospho-beta-glucosidase/beta-galactosidase
MGVHAPGERSMQAAMAALHVTNLAHGLGVQAIRAERSDLPVGIVLNAMSVMAASASDADRKAAERANDFHNGVFFGPLFMAPIRTQYSRDVRIWRGISRTAISRRSTSRSISGV